jgi:hypothetical protein
MDVSLTLVVSPQMVQAIKGKHFDYHPNHFEKKSPF